MTDKRRTASHERRLPPDRARDRVCEAALAWGLRTFDSNAVARLGPLQRHKPICRLPGTVVVTAREDVVAVLADQETYAPPYRSRLPGPFLLGQTGRDHAHSRAALSRVLPDTDADRLRQVVRRTAVPRVEQGRAIGWLDIGDDLVFPVMDAIVREYVGLPTPDYATQRRWARALFEDIFLNRVGIPTVRSRVERAAREMHEHVDDLIAARQEDVGSSADEPTDVLGRLLRLEQDHKDAAPEPAEIRDNLIGLAIGWLWHGAKGALLAIDELLNRPAELEAAQAAAERDDMVLLRGLIWECLRFRPVQPGLFRICSRDATLAAGTARERRVKAGTWLFVGTHSAMWDASAVPDPARFDPTRADGQYLIFADGPHRCLGAWIMGQQLPELLATLLVAAPRRADGVLGRMHWQGPLPVGFHVQLG